MKLRRKLYSEKGKHIITGSLLGGISGAMLGGLIGKKKGALIGAGLGMLQGAYAGYSTHNTLGVLSEVEKLLPEDYDKFIKCFEESSIYLDKEISKQKIDDFSSFELFMDVGLEVLQHKERMVRFYKNYKKDNSNSICPIFSITSPRDSNLESTTFHCDLNTQNWYTSTFGKTNYKKIKSLRQELVNEFLEFRKIVHAVDKDYEYNFLLDIFINYLVNLIKKKIK